MDTNDAVIEEILIFFSIPLLIGIRVSILRRDSASWPPSRQAARAKGPANLKNRRWYGDPKIHLVTQSNMRSYYIYVFDAYRSSR